MHNLFDRRGERQVRHRPKDCSPSETPVGVNMPRSNRSLLPQQRSVKGVKLDEAQLRKGGNFRPLLIGAALLTSMIVATGVFMTAFSATFEAVTRAIPGNGLSTPHTNAIRALVRERDRRRAALASYDRQIAATESDPKLQEAWCALKQHEAKMVERLAQMLDSNGRSSLALAGEP